MVIFHYECFLLMPLARLSWAKIYGVLRSMNKSFVLWERLDMGDWNILKIHMLIVKVIRMIIMTCHFGTTCHDQMGSTALCSGGLVRILYLPEYMTRILPQICLKNVSAPYHAQSYTHSVNRKYVFIMARWMKKTAAIVIVRYFIVLIVCCMPVWAEDVLWILQRELLHGWKCQQ